MRPRFTIRCLISTVVLGLGMLASSPAHAALCSTDSECPNHFTCVPTNNGTDAGAGVCEYLECKADSDCAAAFRCAFDLVTDCLTEGDSGSDAGQACGPGSACVPQWQAPCTDDKQCGPGFTCSGTSGGVYDCGPREDAVVPPGATATVVPCSEVPGPPNVCGSTDAGCIEPPSICKAGSSCLLISEQSCVEQPTGPCTVDSDCPSTWTCECGSGYGGPGGPVNILDSSAGDGDGACTKSCIPPNSGMGIFGPGASSSSPAPTSPPGMPASGSPDAGALSGAHDAQGASSDSSGGCQLAAGNDLASVPFGALVILGYFARARRYLAPHRRGKLAWRTRMRRR
jgi:hypothetical protein